MGSAVVKKLWVRAINNNRVKAANNPGVTTPEQLHAYRMGVSLAIREIGTLSSKQQELPTQNPMLPRVSQHGFPPLFIDREINSAPSPTLNCNRSLQPRPPAISFSGWPL